MKNSHTFRNTTLYSFLYDHGHVPEGWLDFFNSSETKDHIKIISEKIENSLQDKTHEINPPLANVFKAFELCPLETTKVVIIGQDPAPEIGLAQGLSFSIPSTVSTNRVPSIQRVLLEARNEGVQVDIYNGDLTKWAKEGVLLLNETLTILCHKERDYCTPDSHKEVWEKFVPSLLSYLNHHLDALVFILWGHDAQKHENLIDQSKFKILNGGHPSPLAKSESFFCKNYFAKANEYLKEKKIKAIDWNLTDKKNQVNQSYVWGWDMSKKQSFPEKACSSN